jgi:hypothetical protein
VTHVVKYINVWLQVMPHSPAAMITPMKSAPKVLSSKTTGGAFGSIAAAMFVQSSVAVKVKEMPRMFR